MPPHMPERDGWSVRRTSPHPARATPRRKAPARGRRGPGRRPLAAPGNRARGRARGRHAPAGRTRHTPRPPSARPPGSAAPRSGPTESLRKPDRQVSHRARNGPPTVTAARETPNSVPCTQQERGPRRCTPPPASPPRRNARHPNAPVPHTGRGPSGTGNRQWPYTSSRAASHTAGEKTPGGTAPAATPPADPTGRDTEEQPRRRCNGRFRALRHPQGENTCGMRTEHLRTVTMTGESRPPRSREQHRAGHRRQVARRRGHAPAQGRPGRIPGTRTRRRHLSETVRDKRRQTRREGT